ncbi:eCIS core domain-containing protein [Methanosarcina horonobensis]|uniref:eCIS core domain-containing protein n=1 Tax=Methanosarcina horonobensis TaxID=418008 RepID=UPI000A9ADB59|nr:DUF4157 domain-containing protein [Methanosarcina horonobensis]
MAEKARIYAKIKESKQKCSNFYNQKPRYNSSGSPADRTLQLQRTAGNQAVQRLIKSGALQTKLKIGQPNDIYEQEADRVAEQVMRMPDPVPERRSTERNENKERFLQTKKSPEQAPVTQGQESVPPVINKVLQSPGQPLDPATRTFMEPRFGYDLSLVRVHSGTAAEQSAQEVNAQAYTIGQNIVFGTGQFAPGTQKGRQLLAHELTHIVQQNALLANQSTSNGVIQRKPAPDAKTVSENKARLDRLARNPREAHRAWKRLNIQDSSLF